MLHELLALRERVENENACVLPGCSIKPDVFVPLIRRAMSRGYVRDEHGEHVIRGLRHGFTLGVDRAQFERAGKRVFRNYPSAYQAKVSLSSAIDSRVARGKTLKLGNWSVVKPALDSLNISYFVFPMGAVPKPHQPEVMRPTSDHTRTGLNALINLGILKHTLNTYGAVRWWLEHFYYIYVSDVNDAFPILPIAPWLWFAMIFRWYGSQAAATHADARDDETLVHLFADFGTSGAPGEFKIFFVDVVVGVARSEMVISLPLVVHVDDLALIGPQQGRVNSEMRAFQPWCEEAGTGVTFKDLKDKPAAIPQYYCGFWWDSRYFTRYLEEDKLLRYLDAFADAASARSHTLRDLRSLAGKAQRAIMTFPPGAACLIVNCFLLMRGLTLGWQRRRSSKAVRADFAFLHDLLQLNLGRGYFSYAGFATACDHRSDASKSAALTAGGWVAASGDCDWFVYGSRASRNLIDALEGDVMVRCCESLSTDGRWYLHQVPFGLDSQAFQRSAVAGRSRAERLNEHLRHLFVLQVRREFVLQTYWLNTDENYLADDLSRARPGHFFARLAGSGFLVVPVSDVRMCPDAGRTVHFDRPGSVQALRQCLKEYDSNNLRDGPSTLSTLRVRGGMPSRGKGVEGDAQILSVSYSQTSIYKGLPPHMETRLDEVMDNRLAPSSRDKVMSGVKRWMACCAENGWDPILEDDDEERGGKMCAWVLSMCDETELAFASICTYVWGMRTWQVMQHRQDPAFGCRHWREFIRSVAVLTAVPGEPREQVPLSVVRDVLASLDQSDFRDVNFGLMMLTLLFTFSRTECPCPKTWSGRDVFDKAQHWTVGDFKLLPSSSGDGFVLWVRIKRIKQDARIERPSAHTAVPWLPFDPVNDGHGRDWVPIGDVADPLFSISKWFIAHTRAIGRERADDEPMFLALDKSRAYTYSCLSSDFKHYVASVGGKASLGPHGLRVLGYNLSKAAVGPELTQAHGGWMSSGHSRYERFAQSLVLGIPAAMLGLLSSYGTPTSPRHVLRSRTTRGPAVLAGPDEEGYSSEEPPAEAAGPSGAAADREEMPASIGDESGVVDVRAPPGVLRVDRVTASGRSYSQWVSADGQRFPSRKQAWAEHAAAASPRRPSPSPPSGAPPSRAESRARRSASPRRALPPPPPPPLADARPPPPEHLAASEARLLFPPAHEDNWGLARPDVSLPRSARSARPS